MTNMEKIEQASVGLHKDVFINGKAALTFDDVWMVPQHSSIASRDEVDLTWEIFPGVEVGNPIVATCMDTVCGPDMLEEMWQLDGCGMLHRNCSAQDQFEMFKSVISRVATYDSLLVRPRVFGFAVSCGTWKERMDLFAPLLEEFRDSNRFFVCLDAAHGHTDIYRDTLEKLHSYCHENFTRPPSILAGTVATAQAVEFLYRFCDGIRVGVGSGSSCITRIQTGHGVPLFQSLIECAEECHLLGVSCFADGGLRTSGDLVKALAIGADALDMGGVIAATSKSPAEKVKDDSGNVMSVRYRGQASKAAQEDYSEKRTSGYYVEGEEFEMDYKGETKDVIADLLRGMRSGLTYSGARNVFELRDKARFRMATMAGLAEAKPHGKK